MPARRGQRGGTLGFCTFYSAVRCWAGELRKNLPLGGGSEWKGPAGPQWDGR